jgi:hypothetical protein
MIRHVVMFRFKDGTSPAAVTAIAEGLGGLPAAIPEIAEYRFGSDIGVNDGNFDFAVVADFADTADYLVYRDHPLHQALIRERIAPHVDARAAVQFDLLR